MFKKFIQRIIDCKNQDEAIEKVFYGSKYERGRIVEYGVDLAFQHGKITWQEHEMLLSLIEKMA